MPIKPFINSQNARELQRKGVEAKLAKKLIIPQEPPQQIDLPPIQSIQEEEFQSAMLINVRAQIRLILARVDKELERSKLDTKALKELGETLARFETMEQKLSNRAAPGSFKPTAPPRKAGRSQPEDFEPLPAARSAAKPRPTGPEVEPAPAQAASAPDLPPPFIPTDFSKLE